MFFFLSKILQFLISPVVWVFTLLLLSLILRKKAVSVKLMIIGFALLAFFTNPFLYYESMKLWEPAVVSKKELNAPYDYGIVLGGMIKYENTDSRIVFRNAADRLFQAIELYKEGYIRKIYITSGSGEVFNQHLKEAVILKDYLITIGIPADDILIESDSRNTYENAVKSAEILLPGQTNDKYLLITSAFHMKRASGCFKKQNFEFDTYPTDFYSGGRKFTPDMLIVPDPSALSGWTILIHEITGYIVYKIVGYSS